MLSAPVPVSSRGASARPATVAARLASTAPMRAAYGRAASAAACARLSLEAATICIARVIFCVAFTEAMRLRSSLRLAMGQAKTLAKPSAISLSFSRRLSLSSRLSRISASTSVWSVLNSASRPFSKSFTLLTGSLSR